MPRRLESEPQSTTRCHATIKRARRKNHPMKTAVTRLCLSVVLCFAAAFPAVCAAAAGRPANVDPIVSFDMVAPGTGWAASYAHLYWTNDNGRRWSDITPPRISPDDLIQLVYFADRLHGWIPLLKTREDQPPNLRVAMTGNGGSSWRYTLVDLAQLPFVPSAPPTIASMAFSDPMHGWILLGTSSSQLSRQGSLLATADGGLHWRFLPPPPLDGSVSFGSASNGVMTEALNPYSNTAVWHTRDGGQTWKASTLPLPESCPKCVLDQISRAFFFDAQHALLTAMIRTPGLDDFLSAEYRSIDVGATWNIDRSSAPRSSNAGFALIAVADGRTIRVSAAPHNSLVLKIDEHSTTVILPGDVTPGSIDRLSVASDGSVWVLSSYPRADIYSIEPHSRNVKRITPP